ncbi:MAG TPA: DNA-processing protein DprA [Candidatus Saccharimonadales bacterium]|nr:DNA-processing protein DprA [Candidatus Saccharimonadales bacterium]
MSVKKITQKNTDFPEVLRHIPQPPKQLYVLGNLAPLIDKTAVSIVGSRAVTPYGRQVTTRLATELTKHGIAIVSGLALGVDGLAHQAALDTGGYTVAVLACGLDRFYPSTHHNLAKRILASGGAIISEYPEGTEPFPANFIERNRIVSGLGNGLLIIEATERSGTLHTANFALEQGKTVMAVPGNITSANSVGTNNLIKTGAVPVSGVGDILHALNINVQTSLLTVVAANEEEAAILELMQQGMTDGSELQEHSELSPEIFNQTLTMLEISGKIRPLGGGLWGLQ